MILVRLMGGLGNQMFQYAAAKSVAVRNKTILKIDTTLLEENKKHPHEIVTHRELDLAIFDLPLMKATKEEVEYFNGKKYRFLIGKIYNKIGSVKRKRNLIIEKDRSFNKNILRLGDNKCIVGSWQSEKYFKDIESEIRNLFTFKLPVLDTSKDFLNDIKSHDSICLNVRRGDFVTSPLYSNTLGALTADYYIKAIEYFEGRVTRPKVFVFSDDMDWCKNNLKLKMPVCFVGHEHAGEKFGNYLQLMKNCNHFVIPNSSFGWWGAWLSKHQDKIVIAPKNWFKDAAMKDKDIVPENWIRI